MRRPLLAATLVLALAGSGCGVLMRFVGERVADAVTQKTDDLSQASIAATYTAGLYPSDANTYETEGLADAWKAGANMINVNLLKRHGVGMWELDGSVTARKGPKDPAVPLKYMGKGAYLLILPPGDRAPRTIEVKSASGQSASFVVKPASPVKIKSVNGKYAGANVDLWKDLVIDLDGVGPGQLKVMLAATTLGIRTMTDVAVCKPAKRLVVPAAAFRHLGVTASVAGFVGIDQGANYVVVERFEGGGIARPGQAGAAFTIGKAWSAVPVNVTGDAKNAAMLPIEGEVANPRGSLIYNFGKQPAFYAPPLARARRVAIGSLAVRGVLFKQYSSSSTRHGLGTITTTTTTTTLAFPKVAPAAWDRLLDDAAAGLEGVARGLGGNATVVPVERVTAAPSYRELETIPPEVNSEVVRKSWRGTRDVLAFSSQAPLGGVSSTFALDRPHVRLLREAGADALLSANLDLQIGTYKDSKNLVLVPRLHFTMMGGANGYNVGPTQYVAGWVSATEGVTFTEAELSDLGALRRIARLDDMLGGLRQALQAVRQRERQEGYEAIWALQ